MKKELDKMALAAEKFHIAIHQIPGSISFNEIMTLYVSSFMHTTMAVFDKESEIAEAVQHLKNYVNEIDPAKVAKIHGNHKKEEPENGNTK